jgi:hypothetical protein
MKDLKVKTDGSTNLTYTGLCGELEHLKIEMRLIGESIGCVGWVTWVSVSVVPQHW